MGGLPLRVLSIGLTGLLLAGCKRTPYSSPTALRDTNAYVRAMSPPLPLMPDLTRLDQCTATLDGEDLRVTYPTSSGSEPASDGLRHAVTRLGAGGKIQGDGASFEVVAISVSGPGISRKPADGNRMVPLDFFAPDGRPLSPDELKSLGLREWQLTDYDGSGYTYIGESYPRVKVWFGSKSAPPKYVRPVNVFDSRTKLSLSSGHSYSQATTNGFGFVEFRPRAWHATPMEMVMDVELDGESVVQTNAIAGMTVPVAGGAVRILGIWDGGSSSWSSSSGSSPGVQTLKVHLQERGDQTNAVALVVTEPPRLAVHCELLDAQGRKLQGSGGGTTGGIRLVGFRGRADEAKLVRFTVYTNHQRVVLALPPLPNLPTAGGPVSNLFEVPIPMLHIQREHELRDVIGTITQLRFVYPPGGNVMPTNLFPLTLTNVTAADLVTIYSSHLAHGSIVVVDDRKQEIRVEPPPIEKIRRWVKQKLRL